MGNTNRIESQFSPRALSTKKSPYSQGAITGNASGPCGPASQTGATGFQRHDIILTFLKPPHSQLKHITKAMVLIRLLVSDVPEN